MSQKRVIALVILFVLAIVCIGSVYAWKECTYCKGTGVRTCIPCGGTGRYGNAPHSVCYGTGYVNCGYCGGKGGRN